MKQCFNCHQNIDENAAVCPYCNAPQYANQPKNTYCDQTDHTSEFDADDISDNKVFAMLPYLLGIFGVIISLLASSQSKYTAFHVRQYLKILITETLIVIASAILFWTIIIPILGGIAVGVLGVVDIICFFNVCGGKAKEAPIVKNFGFLK